jgi:hypothetical protein
VPCLADDFAPIRTRLRDLRGEVFMREDAVTERYPRHVMDAALRLLHELPAKRPARDRH